MLSEITKSGSAVLVATIVDGGCSFRRYCCLRCKCIHSTSECTQNSQFTYLIVYLIRNAQFNHYDIVSFALELIHDTENHRVWRKFIARGIHMYGCMGITIKMFNNRIGSLKDTWFDAEFAIVVGRIDFLFAVRFCGFSLTHEFDITRWNMG